MAFDRWSAPRNPQSLTRLYEKRYIQDLNNLYWCGMAGIDTTLYQAKNQHDIEAHQIITLKSAEHRQRIMNFSIDEWRNNAVNFETWTNHNVTIALSSIFEMYLLKITSLAIESNPGILVYSSKQIDGGILLIKKKEYSYRETCKGICMGSWDVRIKKYHDIFGNVPKVLLDELDELDELRKTRNQIGHIYAREMKYKAELDQLYPMKKLSQNRVLKWMNCVDKVSKAIDEHLFVDHIGMYELIWLYKKWVREKSIKPSASDFRKKLVTEGYNISQSICKSIENYYDRALFS